MERTRVLGLGILFISVAVGPLLVQQVFKFLVIEKPSQIVCSRDISQNKMCLLFPTTYNQTSHEFNVFIDERTIVSGLRSYKDLQDIQLSSVKAHNRFFANVTISVTPLIQERCTEAVEGVVILISRFKPDNLMHVIHDDILPLFTTWETLCGIKWHHKNCRRQTYLMLMDGHDDGPFSFLYQMFTENTLINTKTLKNCVSINAHAGLNLDSIWYQYGFKEARGPLRTSHLKSSTLTRFRTFVFASLGVQVTPTTARRRRVVILERTLHRKLVNIEKMKEMALSAYGRDVECIVASVIPNNTQQLIQLLVDTDILIGVHGAEMILALFLPLKSFVIEIMPYGIPSSVSFLAPLKTLRVAHFGYIQLLNYDREFRTAHPEYPPHLGGLGHLPAYQRESIKALRGIKDVHCCDDPAFLHLMYQDTIVSDRFYDALLKSNHSFLHSDDLISEWFYPGAVQFPQCVIRKDSINVSWLPPLNVHGHAVEFGVSVKMDSETVELVTKELSISLARSVSQAVVWVYATCIKTGRSSTDTYVTCVQ